MSYPKLTPIIAKEATEPRYLDDRFADFINVKDYGAKGDGETDDTEAIQAALDAGLETGKTIVFPAGQYNFIKASVTADETHRHISLQALGHVVLYSINHDHDITVPEDDDLQHGWTIEYALGFFGKRRQNRQNISVGIERGEDVVAAVVEDSVSGDLVLMRSTQLVSGENRSNWTVGQVAKILSIESGSTHFCNVFEKSYPEASTTSLTLTVEETVENGTTIVKKYFNDLNVTSTRDAMFRLDCVSGANAGDYAFITDFDNETKEVWIGDDEPNASYRAPFSNSLSNGEVFNLVKQTYAETVIPITVKIAGDFHLTRDVVTTRGVEINEDEQDTNNGFRGVSIRYGDGCYINGMTVENFDCNGILLWHCYKSVVENIHAINANSDDVGYGVLFYGAYGCRVSYSKFSKNRSATSTDGGKLGSCQSVNNVVDHCVCYGTGNATHFLDNAETTRSKYFYPRGTIVNQAFSTHGDAVNHVIDSCQWYGTYAGSRLRGENDTIMNCSAVGNFGSMITLRCTDGVNILNNTLSSNIPAMGYVSDFIVFSADAHKDWKHSLKISGNKVYNVTGHFIRFRNNDDITVYKKFIITDNVVALSSEEVYDSSNNLVNYEKSAIGRNKNNEDAPLVAESYISNNVCTLTNGKIVPFAAWGRGINTPFDSWVQVGYMQYCIRLTASTGKSSIPIGDRYRTPIMLTLTQPTANMSPMCTRVVIRDVDYAYSNGEPYDVLDTSVLRFNNKNKVYVLKSATDTKKSGYINVILQSGVLTIYNNTTSVYAFFVKIETTD